MSRENALGVLFCELLSADALRQFLRFDPRGAAISSQLPASPSYPGEVHRCAVALLGNAGLIDRELFTRLVMQFPSRRDDIRQIAERWVDTDGKQQRVAATTAAPTTVAVQPDGPTALAFGKVLHPSTGLPPDVARFEIRANSDCIVHWCGVSAAKVVPRDTAWTIWPHPEARLRSGLGRLEAGEVIAVITDAATTTVQALIAERASQLVDLAPDGAHVPKDEAVAVLEVSQPLQLGFQIDARGSDFAGVLRWQPALTDPVWLGSSSERPSPMVRQSLTVDASDCDLDRGLHVVHAVPRGVIVALAPDLKRGDCVERNQLLCRQQLDARWIEIRSPLKARVENVNISIGAKVFPGKPMISLRRAPASPHVRVGIAATGLQPLYLVHAPLPGIFLATPHRSAAVIPSPAQAVEREKPLCTILGPGGVPCDIFTDVYGVVTRVIAPPAHVRRGAPLLEVRVDRYYFVAPFVGTYYKGTRGREVPFVHVGKSIRRGDILCIIEALKLEYEFESDVDGIVEEILVENGHPVEYGQPLIILRVG
jgi:acetyl-CoA carboxylase biotin carboxyl carrier protein